MAYAQWVGTFDTEEEAIRKINTMREKGMRSQDIAVLISDEKRIEALYQEGDLQLETMEQSWAEKIMSGVEIEGGTNGTLNNEGLDEEIKEEYKEEVEQGKIIVFTARKEDPEDIGEERIEGASVEGVPTNGDINEIEYSDSGINVSSEQKEEEDIPVTEKYRKKQTEELKNR